MKDYYETDTELKTLRQASIMWLIDFEIEMDRDQAWPPCSIHMWYPVWGCNKMLGDTCFSSFLRNDNNSRTSNNTTARTNQRYCIEVWDLFRIQCFNLSQSFTYRFIMVSVWIFKREFFPTVGRVTVIDRQINASKIQNTFRWVTKGWCLSDCLIIFCIPNSLAIFMKIFSFIFRYREKIGMIYYYW